MLRYGTLRAHLWYALAIFPMRPHPWFQFVKCQQLRQVGMLGVPIGPWECVLEIWLEC